MLVLRILAIATVVLFAFAGFGVAKGKPSPADRMVDRINDVRERHGLRPLKAAPRLERTSGRFARRMVRTNSFGHGSAYRHAGFSKAGEIIALRHGLKRRTAPVMRMWMHSSGHRSLVLSPSFRYVGASPARGRFGGAPTTVWVVHFGAH